MCGMNVKEREIETVGHRGVSYFADVSEYALHSGQQR